MAEVKRSRLFFLGFPRPGVASYVLDVIKEAKKANEIVVTDWAMIQKPEGGEAKISTDRTVDPGAARGAGVGGIAGVVLAGVLGPIGVGAVVGGAAVGAVTAALRDSGLKDDDLKRVSTLMAEGREGLVIVVPIEEGDRFQAFMDATSDFHAADSKLSVDIVPGRTLQDAIDHYVEHEDD
jgi:uncharacterized membrane protein